MNSFQKSLLPVFDIEKYFYEIINFTLDIIISSLYRASSAPSSKMNENCFCDSSVLSIFAHKLINKASYQASLCLYASYNSI